MVNGKSIKQLRSNIAVEKARIKSKTTRRDLEKELVRLQKGETTSSKIAKRFGRGFKVIGKKTGKAIIRQGQLIQERQERERKFARKTGKRLRKAQPKPLSNGLNIFERLDF